MKSIKPDALDKFFTSFWIVNHIQYFLRHTFWVVT